MRSPTRGCGNRESNLDGWRAYLGAEPGSAGVSPYAAAARATDLPGLPPAYIAVGTQDLFVDENIGLAQRLIEAGVSVELHIYPGAFHGSELFGPTAALSQRMIADRDQALRRARTQVLEPGDMVGLDRHWSSTALRLRPAEQLAYARTWT